MGSKTSRYAFQFRFHAPSCPARCSIASSAGGRNHASTRDPMTRSPSVRCAAYGLRSGVQTTTSSSSPGGRRRCGGSSVDDDDESIHSKDDDNDNNMDGEGFGVKNELKEIVITMNDDASITTTFLRQNNPLSSAPLLPLSSALLLLPPPPPPPPRFPFMAIQWVGIPKLHRSGGSGGSGGSVRYDFFWVSMQRGPLRPLGLEQHIWITYISWMCELPPWYLIHPTYLSYFWDGTDCSLGFCTVSLTCACVHPTHAAQR